MGGVPQWHHAAGGIGYSTRAAWSWTDRGHDTVTCNRRQVCNSPETSPWVLQVVAPERPPIVPGVTTLDCVHFTRVCMELGQLLYLQSAN